MKKITIIKLTILGISAAACAWYFQGFAGGLISGSAFTSVVIIIIGERALKKFESKKFATNQALKKVIDTLEETN